MIWRSIAGSLAICGAAWADPTPVSYCSRIERSGERILCHETIVPAAAAEVWRLWSTAEGLRTWAAPVVAIELRPGGIFESAYDVTAQIGDAGNIRNRVILVEPGRMLVIQVASAPPGFPHAEEVRDLTTSIELEPMSASATRVRVSMSGYRNGAAFDELYAFFARGNAWTLAKLNERVLGGPVDWRAAAAE